MEPKKPKTFRLDGDSIAALERLKRERDISASDAVRWALERAIEAQEDELEKARINARLAVRDFDFLEEDLTKLPDGPQSWGPVTIDGRDDIAVRIGDIEFQLMSGGNPREWRVMRLHDGGNEIEYGMIENGEIKWTRRIRREVADPADSR